MLAIINMKPVILGRSIGHRGAIGYAYVCDIYMFTGIYPAYIYIYVYIYAYVLDNQRVVGIYIYICVLYNNIYVYELALHMDKCKYTYIPYVYITGQERVIKVYVCFINMNICIYTYMYSFLNPYLRIIYVSVLS
jgi:hypothetical protein